MVVNDDWDVTGLIGYWLTYREFGCLEMNPHPLAPPSPEGEGGPNLTS